MPALKVTPQVVFSVYSDNAVEVALTKNEMEVLPLSLSRLQVYVTLFPKCFSNFRSRYLFAIGLPTLYLTLADAYLPLYTAFPSSATLFAGRKCDVRVCGSMGYHLLWLNTHMKGCIQQWVCFAH